MPQKKPGRRRTPSPPTRPIRKGRSKHKSAPFSPVRRRGKTKKAATLTVLRPKKLILFKSLPGRCAPAPKADALANCATPRLLLPKKRKMLSRLRFGISFEISKISIREGHNPSANDPRQVYLAGVFVFTRSRTHTTHRPQDTDRRF